MKKEQGFKLHVGTASILLVFITLCLVCFALLTLSSTNADYILSKRLAERTSAYYAAVSSAENFLAETDVLLYELARTSANEEQYLAAVKERCGDTLITKIFEINEMQSLQVSVQSIYPSPEDLKQTKSCFIITHYQVITDESAYEYNENLMQNIP